MRVAELISGQAKAKGNLEYSSMIVSMYLLVVFEGRGPLKSTLNRSKAGWPLSDCSSEVDEKMASFLHKLYKMKQLVSLVPLSRVGFCWK